jgi:hypothetical protein
MVKSAENRMRSNLELLPVINVKSRPRYRIKWFDIKLVRFVFLNVKQLIDLVSMSHRITTVIQFVLQGKNLSRFPYSHMIYRTFSGLI